MNISALMLLFCFTLAIFYHAFSNIKKQHAPKKTVSTSLTNAKFMPKNIYLMESYY